MKGLMSITPEAQMTSCNGLMNISKARVDSQDGTRGHGNWFTPRLLIQEVKQCEENKRSRIRKVGSTLKI